MKYILSMIFLFSFAVAHAQTNGSVKGKIVDNKGKSVTGSTIIVVGTDKGASANIDGVYKINQVKGGNYTLRVSSIGYKTQEVNISVVSGKTVTKDFVLLENSLELDGIEVVAETETTIIERQGFSVEAIETQKIKTQSLEINTVLDKTPGVRVRTTGGVGSDFEYSLNGMSGNAIRFFIDGIPMDYYGDSYSINNLPISLIDRVDIYKGVVPVSLGSDVLGGAINLITKQDFSNFVEASYSFGSFNTHKISLNGQWRNKSGFTTRLSTFYTYSDNNYKIWGEGVFYGDASTGFQIVEFTEDTPAERFNDDFETISAKVDLGFTNVKWADQFFVTLLASDLKRGIQTAQTMSRVFGKVRNNQQTIMPSLVYKKENFITKGLDVNAFAGYSHTEGVIADTSYVQYDWRGEEIGRRASGGEMGYDGKSLFTQTDGSGVARMNLTYELPKNFTLGVNYMYSSFKRGGEDPFSPEYRIPYLEPQNIYSHFGGLSLETLKLNEKLNVNVFTKYYNYRASINELVYTTEYEIINYKNNISNWGYGFASSYKVSTNFLIKSSVEQATRIPSPTEALGDGVTVSNNPFIKPEQSLNFNVGTILGRYQIGQNHGLKIAMNTFYRDTKDKLLFTVVDARDNGQYQNVDKILGKGVELDVIYDFKRNLKFNMNGTYLDLRNNLEFEENGNTNIFYRDRMRNTPYFLANAGFDFSFKNLIQKDSKTFFYLQSNYVHEFFLDWPSAASEKNKRVIPSQLVFGSGVSYTFPNNKMVFAVDVSNILNEQVYDNYRLQKPGRAIYLKINYKL